ncbi:MAG: 50S ribosomal protein L36 [Rickettsiales bacterium]|jgi:ribosomal protein L36|nr:50S ribosomal protein L36 [Rickettsiales bacterium]
MRVAASIKRCKNRDKDCRVVRRKKTRKDGSQKTVLFVVNRKNPRFKVSQG